MRHPTNQELCFVLPDHSGCTITFAIPTVLNGKCVSPAFCSSDIYGLSPGQLVQNATAVLLWTPNLIGAISSGLRVFTFSIVIQCAAVITCLEDTRLAVQPPRLNSQGYLFF